MKRILIPLIAAVSIGAAAHMASAATSQASGNPCDKVKNYAAHRACEFKYSAPGDEYFGKLKMSYLGINNTYRDEAIRSGEFTTDSNIINKISLADDALDSWATKYPYDPQLARSFYLAIKVHQKIYTHDMQDRAWHYMQLEMSRFANTYFGKQEHKDMAKGFTERYFIDAMPCGLLTPAPAPTGTPRAGQPKVVELLPTCYPSPTPEPTVTPSPHAT